MKYKSFFSSRNAAVLAILTGIVLDMLGIFEVEGIDYVLLFLVGLAISISHAATIEMHANRIMNLTLYHTLLRKGVMKSSDAFYTQNFLTGETYEGDINKLRREFESANIYLNDYLTDEDFATNAEKIKENDVTIFKSFRGLTDRLKKDYVAHIDPDKKEQDL